MPPALPKSMTACRCALPLCGACTEFSPLSGLPYARRVLHLPHFAGIHSPSPLPYSGSPCPTPCTHAHGAATAHPLRGRTPVCIFRTAREGRERASRRAGVGSSDGKRGKSSPLDPFNLLLHTILQFSTTGKSQNFVEIGLFSLRKHI